MDDILKTYTKNTKSSTWTIKIPKEIDFLIKMEVKIIAEINLIFSDFKLNSFNFNLSETANQYVPYLYLPQFNKDTRKLLICDTIVLGQTLCVKQIGKEDVELWIPVFIMPGSKVLLKYE